MMKIKLINVLSGIAFFLFASVSFGQQHYPTNALSYEWTLIKQEKGINFYAKKTDEVVIEGKKPLTFVLVKLENTTSKNAKLLYNLAAFYNEGCQNCGSSQEARKLVELPANGTVEGAVDKGNSPLSIMLQNPNINNGWIPESIAIENLIINN